MAAEKVLELQPEIDLELKLAELKINGFVVLPQVCIITNYMHAP